MVVIGEAKAEEVGNGGVRGRGGWSAQEHLPSLLRQQCLLIRNPFPLSSCFCRKNCTYLSLQLQLQAWTVRTSHTRGQGAQWPDGYVTELDQESHFQSWHCHFAAVGKPSGQKPPYKESWSQSKVSHRAAELTIRKRKQMCLSDLSAIGAQWWGMWHH